MFSLLGSIVKDAVSGELRRDLHAHNAIPTAITQKEIASITSSDEAIAVMKAPWQMKIIDIDVTNKCDLACSNCTRLLENQAGYWEMTPENFRLALRSVADFNGIIAMVGGNPCMHRHFAELCAIFVEEIPEKNRRGLWTNNLFKFQDVALRTFGIFNSNPHNIERGIKSLQAVKNSGWYYNGHSEHSSLLTAVKDLYPEDQVWSRIANCDINREWSANIVQNQGKLRAYFCEIAASFDLARGSDHGIEVTPGWWKKPLVDFKHQIEHFCPGCGVPAKVGAYMDYEETDSYTAANADIALPAKANKNRKIIEIKSLAEAKPVAHPVVSYSTNRHRPVKIAVVTPYYQEAPEILHQCHQSVIAQDTGATVLHYLIADGFPQPQVDQWAARHIKLDIAHADNGNTPRSVGSLIAESEGCDFIAYLDADNWFHPNHLSSLLALHEQTGASVCCSMRTYHRLDGTEMKGLTETFEDEHYHVDTSCILLHKDSFAVNSVWHKMPKPLCANADRIYYAALLNHKLKLAYSDLRTVAFRSQYASHYYQLGESIPDNIKSDHLVKEVFDYLNSLQGIRETVAALGFLPVYDYMTQGFALHKNADGSPKYLVA